MPAHEVGREYDQGSAGEHQAPAGAAGRRVLGQAEGGLQEN